MTRLIAARAIRPAIVVAVWNSPARTREYMTEKALPANDTVFASGIGTEIVRGPVLGDEYLRFLVEELKPYIDRTYRTRRGRADTFIMGSSRGGLLSLYAAAEYPQVFGGVGALSTHWPAGDGVTLDYLARHLPDAATHRIYTDRGTATLDATYPAFQTRADSLFGANGYVAGRNFVTRVFEGAERSWRERVQIPLRFLLKM